MEAMTTLPWGRPLTCADLEAMPDDGHRYELVDRTLIVSPAPRPLHQRVVFRVARLLDDACPDPTFEVFVAPLDVILADDTLLQPDVLVARSADLTERNLPAAPVLAVEVLSDSARGIDLLLKRERLQRARCPTYWVVDPDVPRLDVMELRGDGYHDATSVRGSERFTATAPYDVTVAPAELVARQRAATPLP
jgi:Uma2 family endonuclease